MMRPSHLYSGMRWPRCVVSVPQKPSDFGQCNASVHWLSSARGTEKRRTGKVGTSSVSPALMAGNCVFPLCGRKIAVPTAVARVGAAGFTPLTVWLVDMHLVKSVT